MSKSIVASAIVPASTAHASRVSQRASFCTLLVLGSVLAVAIAGAFGHPERFIQDDAELARLLRGMAVIKGSIVVAAMAALAWRAGMPLTLRLAAVYLLGIWLMAAATVLIWQLTIIPAAAVGFHAGEFALLLAAWRDRGNRATQYRRS